MKQFTRYLISIGISIMLAGLVFGYELQYYDINQHLGLVISNAAFVSGAVMIVAGLLCFVANSGGIDALAYVIYRVKNKFRNVISESYTEFVEIRRENRGIAVDNMFVVGAVMIAIAVVTALLDI